MYNTKRRYKGEPVRPDPTVDPTENETGIYFTSADSSAWISSYEPVVVERLLHHPNFKIEQLITMQIEEEECVVGVIGKLPIGAVRLGRAALRSAQRRPQATQVKSQEKTRKPVTKKPSRAESATKVSRKARPKKRKRPSQKRGR